jgi:diacylglycerol O-acyltransferase / wax synthase
MRAHQRPRLDRLTAQDLLMLRPEDAGWREDIGAVGVLAGETDLERVRALVTSRLPLIPRFRQVLHIPPWWLGRPLWVDAPRFAIEDHVRAAPLAPGAGESEFLAAVERLRIRPFDRARPLWELWLLPGLPDQRVGLYVKLHHSLADGVAGVATIAALLDTDPEAWPGPDIPWTPAPIPSGGRLLADQLRRIGTGVGHAGSALAHPLRSAERLRLLARAAGDIIGQPPLPPTSVNRPIGADRRVALVRSDLDRLKAIGHRHGATVNDVLLAGVTGGYRALLASRGETVDGLALRASVPVSLHTGDGTPDELNNVGSMFVALPVGTARADHALAVVTRETAARKRRVYKVAPGPVLSSRIVQDALWRRFDRQRWATLGVANVPGPPVEMYLAGSRLDEVFPIVPLFGNLTIGVGALSYAGQFSISIVADRTTCPDLDVFVSGLRATLDELSIPQTILIDKSPVILPPGALRSAPHRGTATGARSVFRADR